MCLPEHDLQKNRHVISGTGQIGSEPYSSTTVVPTFERSLNLDTCRNSLSLSRVGELRTERLGFEQGVHLVMYAMVTHTPTGSPSWKAIVTFGCLQQTFQCHLQRTTHRTISEKASMRAALCSHVQADLRWCWKCHRAGKASCITGLFMNRLILSKAPGLARSVACDHANILACTS